MNPERAQMLREIRREYCDNCADQPCPGTLYSNFVCDKFQDSLEDLFIEAEQETEPENENEC